MPPPILQGLLRTTPTISPIAHRALISITGSQSTEFLNGLLGSSVRGPVKSQYSTILHAQGRVMYDVFLYATSNGYLIEYDSRASEAPPLLSYLKRHVLRSKVKIRPVTEEYDVWASWGSAKDREWETKRHWHWERSGAVEPIWSEADQWPWGTTENVILDRRGVGMGRRLLVKKGDKPQDAATHDVASTEEYNLHRIANGVPEGAQDIMPMHAFPMESNLDIMGALDFRKGCYVGQELTVRTYHTGMVRKRIVPVAIQQLGRLEHCSSLFSFPANLDVKPVSVDAERAGPRPRGSGKLLSTQQGLGLALLRLEHVAALQKGSLRLECEFNESTWSVSPWWPDWWPHETGNADTGGDA